MSEIVQTCPLCGSGRNRLFDQREFKGHPVANQLCLACGLVYQSPRMSNPESEAFYESEYRLLYQGGEDPTTRDLAVQRARAASLVDFLKLRVPKISRHLDIGCSTGILLQDMRRAYTCEPVGVEPGKAYRDFARQQGLDVQESLNDLVQSGRKDFDLISLAHVLEHIPEPVEYLANLRENLLNPHGWLLCEVPNLYAHDCFEVAHMISFSARTLTETLRKAGFEVVALEKHGRPRSDLIPYYLTVLAQPDVNKVERRIRPEKYVVLKRRLGMGRRRLFNRLMPRKAWKAV